MFQNIKLYNNYSHINNDIINILEIDELTAPLNNIPINISQIIIKKQYDVLRREHKVPFGCSIIIKNNIITNNFVLNKIQEEDYLDITEVNLLEANILVINNVMPKLTNLKKLIIYNTPLKIYHC